MEAVCLFAYFAQLSPTAPCRFTFLDTAHFALTYVERMTLNGGKDVLLKVLLQLADLAFEIAPGVARTAFAPVAVSPAVIPTIVSAIVPAIFAMFSGQTDTPPPFLD
jgi:hypothetical protein